MEKRVIHFVDGVADLRGKDVTVYSMMPHMLMREVSESPDEELINFVIDILTGSPACADYKITIDKKVMVEQRRAYLATKNYEVTPPEFKDWVYWGFKVYSDFTFTLQFNNVIEYEGEYSGETSSYEKKNG
jgi:hypothetical protein